MCAVLSRLDADLNRSTDQSIEMLSGVGKRRMNNKKTRQRINEVIIQESAVITNLVSGGDGMLLPMSASGCEVRNAQYASVAYYRASGKLKYLRSIAIPRNSTGTINPWKGHDVLIFVDASSRNHKNNKLFVCSASIATWKDEARRFLSICAVDVLVGVCDVKDNPERIGWADIIDRVGVSQYVSRDTKVLVVVDSEKILIADINSRVEPLILGKWLPENHELAFATADAGTEYWVNQEMRRRDNAAKKAMRRVERDPQLLVLLQTLSKLYIKNEFESSLSRNFFGVSS